MNEVLAYILAIPLTVIPMGYLAIYYIREHRAAEEAHRPTKEYVDALIAGEPVEVLEKLQARIDRAAGHQPPTKGPTS